MPANEPRPGRPKRPSGYFTPGPHLLPWNWARERLDRARNYWVASALTDGRPHTRPVWGVWLDRSLFFSTGSRIGTNLAERPDVVAHLESGDDVVIIEGVAERVVDPSALQRFVDAYNPKYNWDFRVESVSGVFAVRPRVAFGWICDSSGLDRGALFGATATCWTFEDD